MKTWKEEWKKKTAYLISPFAVDNSSISTLKTEQTAQNYSKVNSAY